MSAIFYLCTLVTFNVLLTKVFYLVDFREFESLLQRAAPTNGGNVEHSIPELNECSPEGRNGRTINRHVTAVVVVVVVVKEYEEKDSVNNCVLS